MTIKGKFICTVALASIGLWGGSAVYGRQTANASNSTMNKSSDATFAKRADQADLAEVKMGELAQQKAANPAVKQFGERMVTDHSKANTELKQAAAKDNITLPTSMTAKDQATYDKLSKLSGSQFDRQYIKDQVSDHEKVISEFQKEADESGNSNIKNFASQTLPTLQEHLKLARQADQQVMAKYSAADKNGKAAE